MGKMFSAAASIAAVTAAVDMIEILAGTDRSIKIHEIHVTQETEFGDAQAEMLDFSVQFRRGAVTSGTGGAAGTEVDLGGQGATASAATEFGNTTRASGGTQEIFHREAAHVAAGFHFVPTEMARPILGATDLLICGLETAPDDAIDFRATIVWEEF